MDALEAARRLDELRRAKVGSPPPTPSGLDLRELSRYPSPSGNGEPIPIQPEQLRQEAKMQAEAIKAYYDGGAQELAARSKAARERAESLGRWRRCGLGAMHRERAEAGGLAWPAPGLYADVASRLQDGRIVVLLSDKGRGKTQMAAQLLHLWIVGGGKTGEYVRANEIADRARQMYDEECHGRDPLAPMKRADLLVIDEIQERSGTDFDVRTFTAVIDHRYANRKATLMLGNWQASDLESQLGASVLSRISEGGAVHEIKWASFRR